MSSTDRFTDFFISTLKPTGKVTDYRESNTHGFGVRVLPNGTKKFFYAYNYCGKRRFFNLGIYRDNNHKSGVTLKEAKDKYITARRAVLDGKDPLIEKDKLRQDRDRTPFVSDFVDDYIRDYAKQKTRGWKETERVLKKEIIPRWGKWKITDVKRPDLRPLLNEIKERGSLIMANRTLAYVRGMFSYAVECHLIESNPFLGMKMPNEEHSRERVLNAEEIRTLWVNLETADMHPSIKKALKMILITGQRPGEVIGMHSNEIDARWWTIPVSRSKNRQAHRVYLTDIALEIIGDKKGYIFESSAKGGKPFEVRTMTTSIKKNLPHTAASIVTDKLKIAHFVPHDLRRTTATMLAELGISGDIIDRVQNHISKQKAGVGHVYNRYDYSKEKMAALEKWSDRLAEIIESKGVVA
ncbi:MAG TPA: tyrosine-type recombinase/integrase [Stenomitos sp.]